MVCSTSVKDGYKRSPPKRRQIIFRPLTTIDHSDCGGDQKKLFGIVNSLLGRGKQALFLQHDDSLTLAKLFNEFCITKIDNIRHEFPILE